MLATVKRGKFPAGEERLHNHTFFGGDPSNPSWEEYLDSFDKEFQPYITAVREAVEREGLIGATGGSFCNYNYFEFDDKHRTKIGFSWRGFGDLMQAIVNKREGYLTYYM